MLGSSIHSFLFGTSGSSSNESNSNSATTQGAVIHSTTRSPHKQEEAIRESLSSRTQTTVLVQDESTASSSSYFACDNHNDEGGRERERSTSSTHIVTTTTTATRSSSSFSSRVRKYRDVVIGNPYDIFLIHSGEDIKQDFVSPMKTRFETSSALHGNGRCFMDRYMEAHQGSPHHIMEDALESCRHAVVIINKDFLESHSACAELVYAYKRMKWLRDRQKWESLWIVLYKMTLDEYKTMCQQTSSRFPPSRVQSRLPSFFKHNQLFFYPGKYIDSNGLFDAVAEQIHKADQQQQALSQWKTFLETWPNLPDTSFPKSIDIYEKEPPPSPHSLRRSSDGSDAEQPTQALNELPPKRRGPHRVGFASTTLDSDDDEDHRDPRYPKSHLFSGESLGRCESKSDFMQDPDDFNNMASPKKMRPKLQIQEQQAPPIHRMASNSPPHSRYGNLDEDDVRDPGAYFRTSSSSKSLSSLHSASYDCNHSQFLRNAKNPEETRGFDHIGRQSSVPLSASLPRPVTCLDHLNDDICEQNPVSPEIPRMPEKPVLESPDEVTRSLGSSEPPSFAATSSPHASHFPSQSTPAADMDRNTRAQDIDHDNQRRFSGTFTGGVLTGKGSFTDIMKGLEYEGELNMGLPHGIGTCHYTLTNEKFTGQWERGKPVDGRLYKQMNVLHQEGRGPWSNDQEVSSPRTSSSKRTPKCTHSKRKPHARPSGASIFRDTANLKDPPCPTDDNFSTKCKRMGNAPALPCISSSPLQSRDSIDEGFSSDDKLLEGNCRAIPDEESETEASFYRDPPGTLSCLTMSTEDPDGRRVSDSNHDDEVAISTPPNLSRPPSPCDYAPNYRVRVNESDNTTTHVTVHVPKLGNNGQLNRNGTSPYPSASRRQPEHPLTMSTDESDDRQVAKNRENDEVLCNASINLSQPPSPGDLTSRLHGHIIEGSATPAPVSALVPSSESDGQQNRNTRALGTLQANPRNENPISAIPRAWPGVPDEIPIAILQESLGTDSFISFESVFHTQQLLLQSHQQNTQSLQQLRDFSVIDIPGAPSIGIPPDMDHEGDEHRRKGRRQVPEAAVLAVQDFPSAIFPPDLEFKDQGRNLEDIVVQRNAEVSRPMPSHNEENTIAINPGESARPQTITIPLHVEENGVAATPPDSAPSQNSAFRLVVSDESECLSRRTCRLIVFSVVFVCVMIVGLFTIYALTISKAFSEDKSGGENGSSSGRTLIMAYPKNRFLSEHGSLSLRQGRKGAKQPRYA